MKQIYDDLANANESIERLEESLVDMDLKYANLVGEMEVVMQTAEDLLEVYMVQETEVLEYVSTWGSPKWSGIPIKLEK